MFVVFDLYLSDALRLHGQATRAISTGQLHALLHFHTQPINVVVFNDPSGSLKLREN